MNLVYGMRVQSANHCLVLTGRNLKFDYTKWIIVLEKVDKKDLFPQETPEIKH